MRYDQRSSKSPLWTQGRVIELVVFISLVCLQFIYAAVMLLSDFGTSWGAMGIAFIMGICVAPLQIAWLIWFVVRLSIASGRNRAD